MKIIISFILSLFLVTAIAQYPNDCVNYVQVCGNYDINLNVSGAGVQEIGFNVCQSNEHNSLWLHILIEESGTLGFNLKPESSSITEDYDFWVFGPNVTCGNLNQSIRCSTTNPQAAGQTNNWTGMNGTAQDFTEGPGPDGDSYVRWLDVTAGEDYFLVIDRPIGYSAFELEWIGTAVLDNPLEEYTIYDVQPLQICDAGNDGTETFDLSTIANEWINDLTGIEITYHLSENDAFSDVNPIPTPANLQTRTYYVRIENVASRCFEVKTLEVEIGGLALQEPTIRLCDEGNDQQEIYDLSSISLFDETLNYTVSYHISQSDAENNVNPISPENHLVTENDNIIYIRVTNEDDCTDYTSIVFELIEKPEVGDQTSEICINQIDENFTLTQYNNLFQEQSQFTVNYYATQDDRENNIPINMQQYTFQIGENPIFVRVNNAECYQDLIFNLSVYDEPEIGEDETIVICPEELPYSLPDVASGYNSYVWSTQEEGVTSITINDIGDYQVTVGDQEGCEATKTYYVSYISSPQITELLVENETQITVYVISEDTQDVLYSIDNSDWQESPVFENVSPGFHSIRVKLPNGCISDPETTYLLQITNFLSPNNDGLNDTWTFPGLDEFEGSFIEIYDRYGKLIYQEDGGKPFVWDGTFNGRKLPSDDYWYIISLPDGRKHIGHITIKN